MSSASCRIMTVWHGMGVKFNLKHVTALVSFSSLQRQCCFVFWAFDAWQHFAWLHPAGW